MTYEININDSKTIALEESSLSEHHFSQLKDNTYHIRIGTRNFECEVLPSNDSKHTKIIVNDKEYSIEIKDEIDILLSKMGLNKIAEVDASDIYSPMPGLVLNCLVEEGEEVEKDQPIVILEAMKMENIIKAQGKGIVEKIMINTGDKVEKAQLLVSIKQ